jgi:hypothetical protein
MADSACRHSCSGVAAVVKDDVEEALSWSLACGCAFGSQVGRDFLAAGTDAGAGRGVHSLGEKRMVSPGGYAEMRVCSGDDGESWRDPEECESPAAASQPYGRRLHRRIRCCPFP